MCCSVSGYSTSILLIDLESGAIVKKEEMERLSKSIGDFYVLGCAEALQGGVGYLVGYRVSGIGRVIKVSLKEGKILADK